MIEDTGNHFNRDDEDALMALNGAASFRHDVETEEESGEKTSAWDEHSLSEQRCNDIICWVYGSNPEKLTQLTASGDGPLPDERAERCADEWRRVSSAWERIPAEHVVTDRPAEAMKSGGSDARIGLPSSATL